MIKDAVINGKTVELCDTDAKAAEIFHSGRLAFAFVGDGMKLEFCNFGDVRDHQHWLLDEFGVSKEQFESVPRGYVKPGRVQLFMGSGFNKIPNPKIGNIHLSQWSAIADKHRELFGTGIVEVFNGVQNGKIGEVWEPLEKILELNVV